MGASLPRPVAPAARLETPIEEWPYLDIEVLVKTRSRKVCMTCHLVPAPCRGALHPGAYLTRRWR